MSLLSNKLKLEVRRTPELVTSRLGQFSNLSLHLLIIYQQNVQLFSQTLKYRLKKLKESSFDIINDKEKAANPHV